jgi:hypothetical protein
MSHAALGLHLSLWLCALLVLVGCGSHTTKWPAIRCDRRSSVNRCEVEKQMGTATETQEHGGDSGA